MDLLRKRILKDGKVAGDGILKVDTFLNHQIDVFLLDEIGKEFHNYFKDKPITKVLTVEASGIAIGAAVAKQFNVPLLFAKKTMSKNIDGEVYTATVKSYTKGLTYLICVAKKFLGEEDNVLLIDDFLANGSALLGLAEIVNQSSATLSGAGIVIEKSFQPGIQRAKDAGINVYSLAEIASISNGKVTFTDEVDE